MNIINFRRNSVKHLLFLFAVLVISCAEENPNLVNPPLPTETVRIRFFNYAADGNERKLKIDEVVTPATSWAGLSPSIQPPAADSVELSTLAGNDIEYTDSSKLKMWRDARYIIFALQKPYSDVPVDTLIKTQTAFATLSDTNKCYISMININNEPEFKYSLVVGCPNGVTAFPPISYMNRSIEFEANSGNYPVSIIKIDASNNRKSLGLFDLQLKPRGDYLFVIMGDDPSQIKLINRREDGPGSIESVDLISSTIAEIRTINFSHASISATKEPDDEFLPALPPTSISDYKSVTACSSDYLDSIVIKVNSEYASHTQVGLVVNYKYSLLVFDSAGIPAKKSIMIENLRNVKYPENHAVVRVIHAGEKLGSFSLSLGARDDNSTSHGFIAGEKLAANLEFGKMSGEAFVLEGRAPITIFSSTSPKQLLKSFIGNFEKNKSYLLVVSGDNGDDINVSIIEEEDVNKNISVLDEGVYAQLVHFQPEKDTISISVDNILTNVRLFYSNSVATVLPFGLINVRTGGTEYSFTAQKDYRDLIVVAGSKDASEIVHVQTIRMAYNNSLYNRRVLNAAKDAPVITVYNSDIELDTNAKPIVIDQQYSTVSDPQSVYLERKFSYFFYDGVGGEFLSQANDIAMTFGKNYTLVFGGSKKIISEDPLVYNYSMLLIQEY